MVCQVSGTPRATAEEMASADRSLLPRALAFRHGCVALRADRDSVVVATANPLSAGLEEEVRFAQRAHVTLRVATPAEVAAALARLYPAQEGVGDAARPEPVDAVEWQARILESALNVDASDVHVEPRADGSLVVRYRVDGALYDALTVPASAAVSLVSRFKVTGGLDISDRIRPQDGRSSVRYQERTVDLRVSTLPLGDRAEKVVVRLLDSRAAEAGLEALGFLPGELHRVEKLLGQREGMMLVTGPTGSGKTTTLYAALGHVQNAETNVVTVEDPIEYRLRGVSQVQVNEKAGLTFAAVLRSMLRQDPDVILVGEIRDAETAAIALKASMTGHLVLSTLHTNDAPSAIHRLLDLGVDPAVLSTSLRGIVAQRLVRRLCEDCARPARLSELPLDQQALLMGRRTERLRVAVGCRACRGTGDRGRLVVPEVMVMTSDAARAVSAGSTTNLLAAVQAGGMLTLWEAGLERVLHGMTSLHELIDNIPAPLDAVPVAGGQADVDTLLATLLGGGGAAQPAPTSPTVVPIRRTSRPGSGPRVLVVDDDREERRAVRAALEAEGCRVLEAADGEAAVSYLRRLAPDAMVTELVLPRLDGIGLLQEAAGRLPVLVYTSQTDGAFREWASEMGAVEVLTKSADRAFLTLRISAALSSAAAPIGGIAREAAAAG